MHITNKVFIGYKLQIKRIISGDKAVRFRTAESTPLNGEHIVFIKFSNPMDKRSFSFTVNGVCRRRFTIIIKREQIIFFYKLISL